MTHLQACPSCDGFVPPTSTQCPNCHAVRPRPQPLLVRACQALAGGAVAVTLMACYGAPAHYKLAQPEATHPSCGEPGSADGDGDGFCAPVDCDDGDGSRYPGAVETVGDELDSDCDGLDTVEAPHEDSGD
jgi:hypothetical protein